MARPAKQGMDYFPHDTDAASDEKLEALRILYGNDGYAFYFILLERIYRTADFELDISDAETRQILARKIEVTPQKFEDILATALKRGCFDAEAYAKRGVLTSAGVKKRAEMVVGKRRKMAETYAKRVSSAETLSETPQRKGKERKEKERKEKESTPFADAEAGEGDAEVFSEKKIALPSREELLPAAGPTPGFAHQGGGDEPPPPWQDDARRLVDEMATLWNLTHAQADARMRFSRFVQALYAAGRGPELRRQFEAYLAFKYMRQERMHSWKTYLGQEARQYADGAWNETDWAAALRNPKNQPHATAHAPGSDFGRAGFGRPTRHFDIEEAVALAGAVAVWSSPPSAADRHDGRAASAGT